MNEKISIGGSLLLAPVPVVLVGCYHEELGNNLITIAWCGVDCSDPPIIHISVRPGRHSYRMIEESGCFTVNFPTRDLMREVDMCGVISGRDGDKFERTGLTPEKSQIVAAPSVAECPVNIECTVRDVIPLGVHDMFLGEVVARSADPSCVTKDKVDFTKLPMIAYCNGEYWSLGEKVGRYGCSMKEI